MKLFVVRGFIVGFFRFRRSIKIAPGIKINLNKKSTSLTIGRRGVHTTINGSGVRNTIGLPGSGLSYTSYHKFDSNSVSTGIPYTRVCPNCGHTVCSEFPEGVNGDVFYGPNVQALVVYLCEEHAVSYQRIKRLMNDMFHIDMSEGTINNIVQRMTKRARALYERIKSKIGKSPVAGADETGIDIAGVLHWLWVWQTETASFFKAHAKRGHKAIEDTFDKGLPDTVLVTDRHGAYFSMNVKTHQICLVHLQRNLVYLTELQPENQWPKDMLNLITDAMKQRREKAWEEIDREGLKKRLDELLDGPLGTDDKEFTGMQKGLSGKKDYIFTFLDNPDVPYDNNASERAVRPAKTKQKVAGLFRTFLGAEAYAVIHSVIDTAKKQDLSPFRELQLIAQLKPSMLTL